MKNNFTTLPLRFSFTLLPKRLESQLVIICFCALAAVGYLSRLHSFSNITERNQDLTVTYASLPADARFINEALPATYHGSTSPINGKQMSAAVIARSSQPYVSAVRPANGATNVALDMSVSVDLMFPSGSSIDGSTVSPSTVKLYEVKGTQKQLVAGTAVNSSAAGDAVTLSASLTLGTNYEFEISGKVKDLKGNALIPFTSRFTTTSVNHNPKTGLEYVAFTAHTLVSSDFGRDGFTTLVVGPDHRLYATTSGGKIERWDIKEDGTLAGHVTISPFGNKRQLLIGLHFDPAATETKLIAWMSHSVFQFQDAQDWSSMITKVDLSDPSSPTSQTYVTNLPRSYKDHSINSIDFGPDGALYVPIGSNTAMGGPSTFWDNRPERLLSAAILRLDIKKAEKQALPIDAKTPDGGGSYNPYAKDAPLTIYATGVRNAYDLVWHSNGQLYVPTNGSAAGGSTPALKSGTVWSNGKKYTGPDIPALIDVRDTQNDYLYRVEKGGYYGHPNPLRNEYILNGGNPTKGEDPGEVEWEVKGKTLGYPVGTPKEPTFRGWSYDFGLNISPNGVIEYKSNAFGGKLKGRLLVCRFSGGDDLIILEPGKSLDIASAVEGIQVPGLRRPYANPLDVIEDELTGNLYISEYFEGNGRGVPQITLLKANVPAGIEVPEEKETATLEVYPNPVPGTEIVVNVHKFEVHEEVELNMLDMAGRQVQSEIIVTDSHGAASTVIEIEQSLQSGVYFIRAQSLSGKVAYKRLVVQ
ncbi:Ig-like domain-containing protein [Pontibacter pamirensis]|uniref:Ig-like domain-containing protein n=1 Tax=Pontibacter pamirensis TaxID=2562824 RepID=UPI001389A149|nr:Ig-like domain-containing protein [Pontibacter pamirensis]